MNAFGAAVRGDGGLVGACVSLCVTGRQGPERTRVCMCHNDGACVSVCACEEDQESSQMLVFVLGMSCSAQSITDVFQVILL